MPISIAEALGCGLPVIARSGPEARDYIGRSGQFYDTVEEAAQLVQGTIGWSRSEWDWARVAALQDATRYTADANLPQVLAHWGDLAAAGSRRPVTQVFGGCARCGSKAEDPVRVVGLLPVRPKLCGFVCLLVDHRFASDAVDGSGPVTAQSNFRKGGAGYKENAIVVRFEFHGV